jgi:hypothetical protein
MGIRTASKNLRFGANLNQRLQGDALIEKRSTSGSLEFPSQLGRLEENPAIRLLRMFLHGK